VHRWGCLTMAGAASHPCERVYAAAGQKLPLPVTIRNCPAVL